MDLARVDGGFSLGDLGVENFMIQSGQHVVNIYDITNSGVERDDLPGDLRDDGDLRFGVHVAL